MTQSRALLFVPILLAMAPATSATEPTAVVELFTSEGCSSCPPADDVLSDLEKRDDVIVLSWHVDYWNRLGWEDPFSDAAYTKRQREYSNAFRLRSIYTPQMIVNGTREFVGSNRRKADETIAMYDGFPVNVAIERATFDGEHLKGAVRISGDNEPALDKLRLLAVVTEDKLVTKSIPRGENKGRTLKHDGVVRALEAVKLNKEGEATFALDFDKDWNVGHASLVILATHPKSPKILGAAEQPLASLTSAAPEETTITR